MGDILSIYCNGEPLYNLFDFRNTHVCNAWHNNQDAKLNLVGR